MSAQNVDYVALCTMSYPVGWQQCLEEHPEGWRCVLHHGHVGLHRYWRASRAGLDWDSGHHRKEWS